MKPTQDLFDLDELVEINAPLDSGTADMRPLADRLRPQNLSDLVGQEHLTGPDGMLTRLLAAGYLPSIILWGPPGVGKTTIARILAQTSGAHYEQISAIFSGVADLRRVFEAARLRAARGVRTFLFVDEIHRFNRAQQDAFLPVVEAGIITLIGATTENPSFELNAALLSRSQVIVLKRLDSDALTKLIERAEVIMERSLPLTLPARMMMIAMADGDGRYLLNMVEQVFIQDKVLDEAGLMAITARRRPLYDKAEDGHYNLISALHKSVRGSDVDAALYWFARMLEGGEDPRFIARRLVRMAVEDIGLADPAALTQSVAAWETYERLGSPEGELALSQAVIYLATAPKSNANYVAYKAARELARSSGSLMPPKTILNAPTQLMADQGYASGYIYDHDTMHGFSGQNYFPDTMKRPFLYHPVMRGFERDIAKRIEYWNNLREQGNKNDT